MSNENADLTALSDDELAARRTEVETEFDALTGDENITAEGLERAQSLADELNAIKGEQTGRTQQIEANKAKMAEIRQSVHGDDSGEGGEGESGGEDAPVAEQPQAVAASGGATTRPAVEGAKRKLNVPLSEVAKRAPAVEMPRRESVLIASADVPGFTLGGKIEGMESLVAAMQARAKGLSDGRGAHNYVPVATLNREFKYNLGPDATPMQINEVLQSAANPDALVAAGGWCSPSEISYDFFNIVCEDGILDLPTVGINRGGIRWPISASFGDLVGNAALFSWSDTQDTAAATGTSQSGTKTCGRVPCATFDEERLGCNGVCLTVGNLMDDAFPELIANHTKLLFAAHAHKMNELRINRLLAESINITGGVGAACSGVAALTLGNAGEGVVANVLGAVELQAVDYRYKFAMCFDAVLEVVMPHWLRSVMRADLRRRTGIELDAFADAYLMSLFDAINVRIQWVDDFQSRTGSFPGQTLPRTSWPTVAQFMIYAPGTFVLGEGLQLNLGVIRDSTLNETNDFTAEWMEECWLVAKMGHESRLICVNICPDGTTGANDLTACGV